MSIWGKIKHAADKGAHAVKEGAEKGEEAAKHAADSGREAASSVFSAHEASALASAIASTGVKVGNGFVSGAEQAGSYFSDPEKLGKGLVAAGRYASEHSCDIAIGSALSAAVVAVALDGEEEVGAGALAVTVESLEAAGENLVSSVVLKTATLAFAKAVADAVWAIPGVSDAPFSKEVLIKVLTYVVLRLLTEKPQLVISTGGQVVVGLVISTITQMVCEGTAPGGFQVWEGAQGSLFDKL